MLRPHVTKLVAVFRFTDLSIVVSLYWLLSQINGLELDQTDRLFLLVTVLLFLLVGAGNHLYRSWRVASIISEISSIALSWIITCVMLSIVSMLVGLTDVLLRTNTLFWVILVPFFLSGWHVAIRLISREFRRHGYNTRIVAIVGCTELGLRLARNTEDAGWMGFRFAGFFEDRRPDNKRMPRNSNFGYPIIGDISELVEKAKTGEIDVVYLALPLSAESRIREIIAELSDTTTAVYLAQDFTMYQLLSGQRVMLGDVHMLTVNESPFYGIDGWVKRFEDIVLCIPIILTIAIPCLLISILIKLDSPGPVLFKQIRYGLYGKGFEIWKFRSMYLENGDRTVPQATRNDPRVTKLGKFLRKTSLDELPQFFNVLAGSMSIVGPRPHAVPHNEFYRKEIDRYMLRHTVKPGITGWAQVNGYRGETSTLDKMEKRIEHDLFYIRNWSILLDLRIIFMTILGVFRNDNVY